jgi:fructokinase
MLAGVDWGGTKMEVVAMSPDGVEHFREREDTPRGDYDACLAVIASLVERAQARVGRCEARPGRGRRHDRG